MTTPVHPESPEAAALRKARWLAALLDESITVPGTSYKIGIDALIGLVPGIGDLVTGALSSYIVGLAISLGLPRATVARMSMNVLIDLAIGAVPFLGDVFDATFKANVRNAKLLEAALVQPARGRKDMGFLVLVIVGLLLAGILFMTLGLQMLRWMIDVVQQR